MKAAGPSSALLLQSMTPVVGRAASRGGVCRGWTLTEASTHALLSLSPPAAAACLVSVFTPDRLRLAVLHSARGGPARWRRGVSAEPTGHSPFTPFSRSPASHGSGGADGPGSELCDLRGCVRVLLSGGVGTP